ncbi:lignin medium expressed protein 8 [Heterobasidion irregulare TC 32-1]|uniref:Cytochrome c oxidase assembly protein COX16, mitochondrial n=1 Tax=Heterobasidion irregulare (strain TC 32-1) TaxID=747525 RepID=W4KKM0_HETIT|nr:lignin medium expressed protein 8 [Heterobasidion irregulare TC 32-1]ETW86362.1 lignin medium expressed protein 8 [Heterobasidion irregulare TC 32-1]
MPTFRSNALNQSAVARAVRRSPLLFGIPFVSLIVGTSFGLQAFTQTRYDLHSQKVTQLTKEQALGLDRNRKKFDIREEYFNLSAAGDAEWEPKRIPRPKGLPEWGVPPEEQPDAQR